MIEEWMNEYDGPIYTGGATHELKILPFEFPEDEDDEYVLDKESKTYVIGSAAPSEDTDNYVFDVERPELSEESFIIGGASMTLTRWLQESFKDVKIR